MVLEIPSSRTIDVEVFSTWRALSCRWLRISTQANSTSGVVRSTREMTRYQETSWIDYLEMVPASTRGTTRLTDGRICDTQSKVQQIRLKKERPRSAEEVRDDLLQGSMILSLHYIFAGDPHALQFCILKIEN